MNVSRKFPNTFYFKGYNLVLENEKGNGVPVSSINKQFSFHPRFIIQKGKRPQQIVPRIFIQHKMRIGKPLINLRPLKMLGYLSVKFLI